MVKEKPNCTGLRFGFLTVLGKGEVVKDNNKSRRLWELLCDCGNIISRPRGDFDRKVPHMTSCGCRRKLGLVDNKRRPHNLTGQRFGNLVAIRLSGNWRHKKPTWLMQCDCGTVCETSLSSIRDKEYYSCRINCGNRQRHPEKYLEYPETPNPYPKESGEILTKYLHLTNLDYGNVNAEVEDEKLDRLIRAAWILTYRRYQGEYFSDEHERRFIIKHLSYCSIDVFWRKQIESNGGFMYTRGGNVKQEVNKIGDVMTDLTTLDYPVIETSGIKILSTNTLPKKLKFKRC